MKKSARANLIICHPACMLRRPHTRDLVLRESILLLRLACLYIWLCCACVRSGRSKVSLSGGVSLSVWPAAMDKKPLSGQVGDLPLASFGNKPPSSTLWPGGEISLVGLIKLLVLPEDQQSVRIMLLERNGFHNKQVGRDEKTPYLMALHVIASPSVAFFSPEKKVQSLTGHLFNLQIVWL